MQSAVQTVKSIALALPSKILSNGTWVKRETLSKFSIVGMVPCLCQSFTADCETWMASAKRDSTVRATSLIQNRIDSANVSFLGIVSRKGVEASREPSCSVSHL